MGLLILGIVSGFLLYDFCSSLRNRAEQWAVKCHKSGEKPQISTTGSGLSGIGRSCAESIKRDLRTFFSFLIVNARTIAGAIVLLFMIWLMVARSPWNPFGYDDYVLARELLGLPVILAVVGLGAGAWLRVYFRQLREDGSPDSSRNSDNSNPPKKTKDPTPPRNGGAGKGGGSSGNNGNSSENADAFSSWFSGHKRGQLIALVLLIVALGASGLIASITTPIGGIEFSGSAATDITEKSSTTNSLLFEQVVLPRQKGTSLSELQPLIKTSLNRDIRFIRWFDSSVWNKMNTAYESTLVFLNNFVIPIFECAVHLEKEGRDKELRRLILPVVRALRTILDGAQSPENEYNVFRNWRDFVVKSRKAVDTELSLLSNKAGCEEQAQSFRELTWITPATLREMTDAPYIHTIFARLLVFTGNDRAAMVNLHKKMRSSDKDVQSIFEGDINSRITIAELFYSERYPVERNMKPYLNWYDEILAIGKHRSETISDFLESCPPMDDPEEELKACADVDQPPSCCEKTHPTCACRNELKNMKSSYERTMRIAKNAIAYRAAEAGLRPGSTLRFAVENHDKKPLFPPYIDTLGYVLIAEAARQDPIPEEDVRKAILLFKEALERTQHTDDEHPATQAYVDAAIQEARLHLIQAKKLLGEFRGEAIPTESIYD